jgi:uncharacterized membrane protein
MKRRSVVLSFAAALAGAGFLVDTRGFSSIEAERTVTVDVVGDENAFLQLEYRSEPVGCEDEFQLVEIGNRTTTALTSVVVSIEHVPDGLSLDQTDEIVVVDGETLDPGESESVMIEVTDDGFTGTGEIEFGVSVHGADISVDTTKPRTVDIDCSQSTAETNETGR